MIIKCRTALLREIAGLKKESLIVRDRESNISDTAINNGELFLSIEI